MTWHWIVMKHNPMSCSKEDMGNGRSHIARAANECQRHPILQDLSLYAAEYNDSVALDQFALRYKVPARRSYYELVMSMKATATAITSVAVQPKNRCRRLMVRSPIKRFDWPIAIMTTMIGTEITPLTIAL
jgi:hypothetical protein